MSQLSQGSSHYPFKYFHDPIHGQVRMDNYCLDIVDTVQFQRLRDLKQLGTGYFVFPGSSHNRFEHSLGVSHLAGTLVERFKATQPELEINEDDIKCVKIAGLCHDLGHGPFSHLFDAEFIPKARPGLAWTHEKGSEMMLDYLIDDNHIDLGENQIKFIKSLIHGVPVSSSQHDEKRFLYDIVANKRNSVDVDKFDYISRDCHCLGIKSSYDFSRLMQFSRVIENEICFQSKEVYNIYEMFHTRYSLFRRVYKHRVSRAIEFMISDALLAADSYMKISESIDYKERYLYLTDSILREIEKSTCEELAGARGIIYDIRRRNIYKFVDEILLPEDLISHMTADTVTPEEIATWKSSQADFSADDVIVDWCVVNYAMSNANPVDNIRFFSRFNDQQAFPIPRHKVSYMIPEQYEETIIRIYSRRPEKVYEIQMAFRAFLRQFRRLSIINPSLTIPAAFESPRRKTSRMRLLESSFTERKKRLFDEIEVPTKGYSDSEAEKR